MNTLFDPENRFWRFMGKITDVFFMGILWFIASLPIITMGAAITSLYQFTLKQADDEEGYVWRSFWRAFRKNFLPATGLWIILLAAGAFLTVDLWACLHMRAPAPFRALCLGILFCLGLIYLLASTYVFPILSRFDFPVKRILAHSFIMAVGNLYISVTLLVIHLVFGIIIYYIPVLFPFFVALAAFTDSYLIRYVFNRYFPKEIEEDGGLQQEEEDSHEPI